MLLVDGLLIVTLEAYLAPVLSKISKFAVISFITESAIVLLARCKSSVTISFHQINLQLFLKYFFNLGFYPIIAVNTQ